MNNKDLVKSSIVQQIDGILEQPLLHYLLGFGQPQHTKYLFYFWKNIEVVFYQGKCF